MYNRMKKKASHVFLGFVLFIYINKNHNLKKIKIQEKTTCKIRGCVVSKQTEHRTRWPGCYTYSDHSKKKSSQFFSNRQLQQKGLSRVYYSLFTGYHDPK